MSESGAGTAGQVNRAWAVFVILAVFFVVLTLEITDDVQNPVNITFDVPAEGTALGVGQSLLVTATTDEPVSSYAWYLNGVPRSVSERAFTIPATLGPGYYWLDLVTISGTYGEVLSSSRIVFRVVSSGSIDGTVTAGTGEVPTFSTTDSNLTGGVLRFTGAAVFQSLNLWSGTWTYSTLPIRLTVRVTDSAGAPLTLADARQIGLPPESGGALIVSGDCRVNLFMQALYGGTWEGALDLYNRMPTPPTNGLVITEFDGGFHFSLQERVSSASACGFLP